MVTYLWTTTDNKYIGINGTVYDEQPTPEEIAELQQIAQGYSNDPYAYQQAFATYVAPKIGVNPDQYFAYYNLNGSCIPGVCDIIVEIAKDETRPRPDIDRIITTDDQGRTIVKIIFYNIDGQCEDCSGTGQLYTNLVYVNSDVCRFDSEGYPSSAGCFNSTPQGCDYMGILITDDLDRDRNDPKKYSWYQIGGFSGGAANSYVCYIFTRAVSQPRTPSGGSYDNWREGFNGYGTTWYDTVPGINNYGIWMSMRTFWSDEGTNLAWSEPALMTDNKIFQTEWAQESDQARNTYLAQKTSGTPKLPSLNGFKDETNLTEGINEDAWRAAAERAGCGEWSDKAVGATYMAWSNCRNGLWDDWTIAKIKGEGGEDGTNAGRMFMIFCSAEKDVEGQMVFPERPVGGHWDIENNILTGSITGGSHLGSKDGPSYHSISWSPDNARQSSDMCTWLSTGTFNGDDGNQIGDWSEPVCITGEDGIDGTDGENREYIYARFATLNDYMCYASGYCYTEDVDCDPAKCEAAYQECQQMLATCTDDAENYQQDDYIPLSGTSVYAHWQDHPEGIEPEWRVEACCLRMKEEIPDPEDPTGESTISQWGCWIGPFVWASWGEDGIDGDGVEYIFCVTPTANRECHFVEFTGDISTVDEWYPLDHVPVGQSDENCLLDDFVHAYIVVGTGEEAKYYYRKTEFTFPHPELFEPPVCREQGIYCDVSYTSTTFTLYGTADTEEEKKLLEAYYQQPEFVPGDKVRSDIADMGSPLMQIAREMRPDASDSELTSWVRNVVGGWDRNWTDNPLDVGPQQPYEWVCIRKYKFGTHDTTKEWQAFSAPKLWANWAFDGTSTFTSMVFTRTNDDIEGMVLCGGTFEIPMPGASEDGTNTCTSEDGTTTVTYDPNTDRSTVQYQDKTYIWEDTVPVFENEQANTDNIWMSMRIFGDEITEQSQGWTSPVRMSDSADFNVEWCTDDVLTQEQINTIKSSDLNFGIYTEAHRDDPEEDAIHSRAERDWEDAVFNATGSHWSDKGDGAVYMATTTFRNGKWTNWTVSKVKGEKGEAGDSVQILGSTKGVSFGLIGGAVFDMSKSPRNDTQRQTLNAINENTNIGDLWGVMNCSDLPGCAEDYGDGYMQFYEKLDDEGHWAALDCITYYDYEASSQAVYDNAQASEKGEYTELPDDPTSASTKYVWLHTSEISEYYQLVNKPLLRTGGTVIVNGITDDATVMQGNATGERLAEGCCDDPNVSHCAGVENGDFFVWSDSDGWTKTANLMGPSSHLHIKYADEVSLTGEYYRLTAPEDGCTNTEDCACKYGEVPGKYIGMYIDGNKADKCGIGGDDFGPYPSGDTRVATQYWSPKAGPYRWARFMGEDGTSFEYVYCLTESNRMDYPEYNNGRPFVPKFKPEFMSGTTYQASDFVPSASNPNIPADAWDLEDQPYETKPDGTYDWTDNAISPDPQKRYRWKVYRTKEKGVWGPYVGDNSTPGKRYAIFDTNCSDELIEGDFMGEFLPVFTDENGKVAEAVSYTREVFLKQAQKEFIITSMTVTWTVAGGSQIVSHTFNNPSNYTFSSSDGISMTANTASTVSCGVTVSEITSLTVSFTTASTVGDGIIMDFTITGHEKDAVVAKTASASLTVVAMNTDVLYYIVPSVPAIKYDGSGKLVTTAVTCSLLKKVIGVEEMTEIDSSHILAYCNQENLNLTWSHDGGPEIVFDGSIEYTGSGGNNQNDPNELIDVKNNLNIYLRKKATPVSAGTLYASEQLLVYADGSTFIKADLDNEQDAIPLTYEGAVDGFVYTYVVRDGSRYAISDSMPSDQSITFYKCVTVSTNLSLFLGSKKTAIQKLSATVDENAEGTEVPSDGQHVIPIVNDGGYKVFVGCTNIESNEDGITCKNVTVYILNGWANFPETLRVRLNAKCGQDNNIYSATFSIAGVRAGSPGQHATIFNLLPESSFIVKHPDGTKSPSVLYCFVQKRTGLETDEYNIESDVQTILSENHMKIIYSKDNSTAWLPYDVHNGVGTEGENGVGTNVIFELVKDTNTDGSNPIDREKVPVVADGEPGRGIIASCRYYMLSSINDSADFSAYVAANCPIPDYGVAPNNWVMIGSYVPSEGSKEVINVNGTIPQTNLEEGSENMYLWMVEVTWYSGGNPAVFKAQPMMLSKDGVGIKDCKNYYVSASTEAYNTVLQNYNAVCADDNLSPTSRGFTEIMPTADIDAGYTIWYFTAIYYTDNTRTCLPLCVFKDGQLIKDIEVLRGIFGEANVEGKAGAYLREFLGVMGEATPDGDIHEAQDFMNNDVKAFLNATKYWRDTSSDLNGERKGRLMFASGVSNLGGRYNNLLPPYYTDTDDGGIDINRFTATLKIWESGFLECTCANIEGRIDATEGHFGKAKNVLISTDGFAAYPTIRQGNEIVANFSVEKPLFEISNDGVEMYGSEALNGDTAKTNMATFELHPNGDFKLYTKKYQGTNSTMYKTHEFIPDYISFARKDYRSEYIGKLNEGGLNLTKVNLGAGQTAETVVDGSHITISGDMDNTARRDSYTSIYSYRFEIVDPYTNTMIQAQDGCISASTGFYQTSDERKKTNIIPLSNVLDTIDAIPTVYYNWKEGDVKTRHIGTLAQGLLPIYPEVVSGSEDTSYTVEYSELSVIALAAIKELKAEVDTLKEEIRKLKEERNG